MIPDHVFPCMPDPTYGQYDPDTVESMDSLKDRLAEASDIRDLSFILSDYLVWGNNKVDTSVGIFNMNSATDCPNARPENADEYEEVDENGETETGYCQVEHGICYAQVSERAYPNALAFRRRQEYLWDSLSAEEWAGAFKSLLSRKRNPVTAIRFSQSGDFRHNQDIRKVNRISQMLSTEDITVYTYSASHKLDWSLATDFTVNASNDKTDYGDRRFIAVGDRSDIPEEAILCPFDAGTQNGVEGDDRIKCGECTKCIEPESEQSRDIAILVH